MKKNCVPFGERLVALAEGGVDEGALQHVRSCKDCETRLAELEKMIAHGRMQFFNAPIEVLKAAKDLMPESRKKVASLLRSTLAWSGARAVAEDFQVVVGSGETRARMMFTRTGHGWQVLGKVPSADWSAVRDGKTLSIDDEGRFSFESPDLASTDLDLIGPEVEIYVPSAEELLASGYSANP